MSGPREQAVRRSETTAVSLRFLVPMSIVVLGGLYAAEIATGNLCEVVPFRVCRSGQPSPEQLRAWIERYGFKTIVNLRGPTAPLAQENAAVAQSLGVETIFLQLSAHELVPRERLVQLLDVLETAEEPILLHCCSGLDRAGTASMLAAWVLGGQTYGYAKWQAYVPPGPWKHRKGHAHISDTFTVYETYCHEHDLNPDDPSRFKYWARNVYHPAAPAVPRPVE